MKFALSTFAALVPIVAWAGSPDKQPLNIGAMAADFQLRDYRGGERSLKEFTGRNLAVIAFLGTECPVARLYAARLVELAKEYEAKGVSFVAIDANQQDSVTDIT